MLARVFFRARLGRLLGVACALAGMARYRSGTNPALLGRWSYPFAGLMLVTTSLVVLLAIRSWRGWRQAEGRSHQAVGARLLDVAALAWGGAYLLSAVDVRENGGRVLDGNLFGSVAPVPAMLEWVSLALLYITAAGWVAHRLDRTWLNGALTLGSLGALYLAGEGAVRIRTLIAPAVVSFPAGSVKAWGRRYVHLNASGFRDAEHTLVRSRPGVRRLLVIGDSYAFGWGIVRLEDRFGEQLGVRMTAVTGQPWEVITVSRPDTHTLHHLEFLRAGLAYRPDAVVLLYVFNDIDYLSTARGFRPLTERNVISEAPQTLAERIHPLRLLYWNSYLFQELFLRGRLVRHRLGERHSVASDPYADSATVAEHLIDLARFVALAREGGAVVGIVPFDPEVRSAAGIRLRDERFIAAAEATGLPVWPTAQAFGALPHAALTVSARDRHPNELANRVAAEAVCPALARALGAADTSRCAM
jgi:hypothetical protein